MAEKHDRNALKAGLFIVISLVLIIVVIVGIKGVGHFIEPDQVRTARFDLKSDVGGLRVGDDVRVGGLKVGIVRSIHIDQPPDPKDAPRVTLSFNMPRRLTLREGAAMGVQSTLTGTAWLNFSSLGDGKPLPDDATIVGAPSSFTQLSESLGQLAPEVQKLAHDLRTVTLPKVNDTAENAKQVTAVAKARIPEVFDRYHQLADRLSEVFVHLRDIFGDTKPDIRRLMANLAHATGTLKEKLPPILDNFEQLTTKINRELDSTTGVLASIRQTVSNTRDATNSARSLLVTNKGKIDDMIRSLKTAGDNLKFATAEIRHSPWRLLYKPGPGEVANLNLYDATRQFAEGANQMSDAATALRDALQDPQSDKAKIESLVQRLDESFGKFQAVENDLWKRVKE
jgi:ABC-type transporter Mla subunit MlaD